MKKEYGQMAGVLLASLYFIHTAFTPKGWHFIDGVDLIFHEAGHTIFIFFGEFIHILMGSGFQIFLPLAITLYFFYTRQQLSGAITLMWTGQNIINVSVYAGDAVLQNLPLLGGDGVHHDWNYLLTTTHLLPYTTQIASTLYALGVATIVGGILIACAMFTKD